MKVQVILLASLAVGILADFFTPAPRLSPEIPISWISCATSFVFKFRNLIDRSHRRFERERNERRSRYEIYLSDRQNEKNDKYSGGANLPTFIYRVLWNRLMNGCAHE